MGSVSEIKVAVVVTGLVRAKNLMGDVRRYNAIQKERFPNCDFFYTTWEDQRPVFEKNFPSEECFYYPQPEKAYHPYLDVKPEHYNEITELYGPRVTWAKGLDTTRKTWTSHHAKQILNYAYMCRDMPQDYDVHIRIRFDSVINKFHQFDKYIKNAYNEGTVHGFAVTRKNAFNEFYDSDTPKHKYYMLDQCIIHRRDVFDTQAAIDAFNEKRLLAAEWGWYQALSHPHGGNHKNHHGFINMDGDVLPMFMMEHT